MLYKLYNISYLYIEAAQNMVLLDLVSGQWVEAEIVPISTTNVPLKKDGWKFNWRHYLNATSKQVFVLRRVGEAHFVEGAVCILISEGMLIMDILEVAPWNYGSKYKKYDHVAGCLIAFSCRKSFMLEGAYKGYLTFTSKTNLIELYVKKYKATLANGSRMYIDPESGLELIEEYLDRKIN